MVKKCSIEDCEKIARRRGWCHMHYGRWYRTGDPFITRGTGHRWTIEDNPSRLTGELSPHWTGRKVSYLTLHKRLYRAHGKASDRDCLHCGDSAEHWAYDHGDPLEVTNAEGITYSLDLDRYISLCVPCHKKFDLQFINSQKEVLF